MAGLETGKLNRRVTLLRSAEQPDGVGGQQMVWGEIGTVWAQAISQNGREAVIAGTLMGVSAWRITMRFSTLTRSLTTADQLRLDGRLLNIRSAEDPDGRREAIVVFADTNAVEG